MFNQNWSILYKSFWKNWGLCICCWDTIIIIILDKTNTLSCLFIKLNSILDNFKLLDKQNTLCKGYIMSTYLMSICNNVYMQLKWYSLSIALSDAKAVYTEKHIPLLTLFGYFLAALLHLFLLRCHAEMHRWWNTAVLPLEPDSLLLLMH